MVTFIFVFALVAGVISFFTRARRSDAGTAYGSGPSDAVGVGWSGGSSPGWYARRGSGSAPYGAPYGGPYGSDYPDAGGYGSPVYGGPGYDGPASPLMSAADAKAEARRWIGLHHGGIRGGPFGGDMFGGGPFGGDMFGGGPFGGEMGGGVDGGGFGRDTVGGGGPC